MSNYIGAQSEQQEEDAILTEFAKAAGTGDPTSAEARALVLRWREHIARYHGGCDDGKLRRMGELYGADDRFAETLDSYGDGTAHFMGDAILTYLENR